MQKLFLICALSMLYILSYGQAPYCSQPLPSTWKWVKRDGRTVTLTPYLIRGIQDHWQIVCYTGDSATGFQKRYLGADVALTDSIRTHGNKNEHMRMHPFMRFLYASEWKDSCQAKDAFWRMVNEHPNHFE